MIKLLVLSILTLSFHSKADDASAMRNISRCLFGLNRNFSPYAGIPGVSQHLSNFRLVSERVSGSSGFADLVYWDSPGEDVTFRYIATTGDNPRILRCSYPSNLSPTDVVFDADAIVSGETNILRRDRAIASRIDVSCRVGNFVPNELISQYISLSPQLYTEMLIDKTGDENWNRIAGNYTPQQIQYSALESCSRLPGTYNRDIISKQQGFQAVWNSYSGHSNGNVVNSTDGSSID